MRKMMLVVISVLSLAACGVDSPQEGAPAVQCKVNSDCVERACDLITETCVTDAEIAAEPSGPSPAEQFGFHQKIEGPISDVMAPESCLSNSDCPSHLCGLLTRTCRDYPL